MQLTATKITFAGIMAILCVHLEALAFPAIILVAVMFIDYATGLMAASHRGQQISSYRSVEGIAKKVCLLLLVAVGLILDMLIVYVRELFGFDFPWSFVLSALIAVWLTANEIISVLENIRDIGVHIPPWLIPLVKNIKSKAEDIPPKFDEQSEEKGENNV